MPSTCLRLRGDQLLERTWVSSTDQAPGSWWKACCVNDGSVALLSSRKSIRGDGHRRGWPLAYDSKIKRRHNAQLLVMP
jgi:hypothetical protein